MTLWLSHCEYHTKQQSWAYLSSCSHPVRPNLTQLLSKGNNHPHRLCAFHGVLISLLIGLKHAYKMTRKKHTPPKTFHIPSKNKWDWKTTYFPFQVLAPFRGTFVSFFWGCSLQITANTPILRYTVPIHWWFHHLSRVDAPLHPTAWL